jgi:hypothetical protein
MGLPDSRGRYGMRSRLRANVRERHIDASRAKEVEASLSSLGESGIFVEMVDPPPKGTILEVEFTVPGRADRTRVYGIVRWREKAGPYTGAGVRFAPIGEAERADVARLIAQGTSSS